jgi:D-alanyl-D-alanine carboxypeptidase
MTMPRRWWLPTHLYCLCLVLSTAALAQTPSCSTGMVPIGPNCTPVVQAADGIRKIVRDTMEKDGLNAVIVSIKIGETTLLTEAWGTSITGVPATTAMHFRNGAVAISYLSTILLQLQQEGRLNIDDPLSKWFPEYPKSGRVTLKMLAGSTSGYADYVNLDILPIYQNVFRAWTNPELIRIGLSQPMKCEPGQCFAYAHTNFVILGEVLSKVTNTPLNELIDSRILKPLALQNTRSEQTAVIPEPVLHAFDGERGNYEDSTYWNPSWTLGDGAVMTTNIADLLTSAIALGSGKLLSESSHALQIAAPDPLVPPLTRTLYHALGIVVGNAWVMQTPSFAGYAATMAYLPSRKIGIAVTATMGPKTPGSPRASDILFAKFGAYLAPQQPPQMAR